MKKTFTPNPLWILLLLFTMLSFNSQAQSGKKHATKVKSNIVIKQGNTPRAAGVLGCNVDQSVNSIYSLLDENGLPYLSYLCVDQDSLSGTFVNGYYYFDGDGYALNIFAGDSVTFSVDSCAGFPVSLTICDSSNTIIPGAYSAPACGNSLNFVAPYSGTYIVVINLNGTCAGGGFDPIGQIYAYRTPGTTLSDCIVVANDLICDAIPLTLNGTYLSGNTNDASAFDADDAIIELDLDCSAPNNTLWYSYTADSTEILAINYTSPTAGGLVGWLGIFTGTTDCTDPLTYVSCKTGPAAADDTVTINFPVDSGATYYFAIDGVSGATGLFSLNLVTGVSGVPCNVDSLTNGIYFFNDTTGTGAFIGYLCDEIDSVAAIGPDNPYYDGDGYTVKLYAGSQVTFRVDNCTGHPVSLSICDSANVVIPGNYSPAACNNSINFTAPYTGSYIVVMNENGICSGGGQTAIGDLYCVRQPGTLLPACAPAPVNDTICGAIELVLNGAFAAGNTIEAAATDPRDADAVDFTNLCSAPNNTLWYSFTPATTDSVDLIMSAGGLGFSAWIAPFTATTCDGALTYESTDCLNGTNNIYDAGPTPGPTGDTAINRLFLNAGTTYYFMIDGYSGAVGSFTLGVQSVITGLNEFENNIRSLAVFPNPANDEVSVKYNFVHAENVQIELMDVTGRVVLTDAFYDARSGQKSINVKSLTNGVYILRLSNGNGSTSRKVLVQH